MIKVTNVILINTFLNKLGSSFAFSEFLFLQKFRAWCPNLPENHSSAYGSKAENPCLRPRESGTDGYSMVMIYYCLSLLSLYILFA